MHADFRMPIYQRSYKFLSYLNPPHYILEKNVNKRKNLNCKGLQEAYVYILFLIWAMGFWFKINFQASPFYHINTSSRNLTTERPIVKMVNSAHISNYTST